MYLNKSGKYLNSEAFAGSGYIRLFLWVTSSGNEKVPPHSWKKGLIFWVSSLWDVILGESKIMIFTPFKIKLKTWVPLTIISSHCDYHLLLLVPALCASQRCCLYWWWDPEGAGLSFTALGCWSAWGAGTIETSPLFLTRAVTAFRDCSAVTGL